MITDAEQLGSTVKAFREQKKLTQAELAEKVGVSRTTVALLEQGRRLPSPDLLDRIARELNAPDGLWEAFRHSEAGRRVQFEAALGELVGRPVSAAALDAEGVDVIQQQIDDLLEQDLTNDQAFDWINRILIFYALPHMQRDFFDSYFGADAFKSVDALEAGVRRYQHDAIRLFSTFEEAYRRMNSGRSLKALLLPLQPRPKEEIAQFRNRTKWDRIVEIEERRLPDLGYVSAPAIRRELQEREFLSKALRELAAQIRDHGGTAVSELSKRRRRVLDSLMRKFGSSIQHGPISSLFSPDPNELEKEAARVAPGKETDLDRIAGTQAAAMKNLANYITADHMDVYVATSMRTDADFISVNRFVSSLFAHSDVRPLNLRFFNPTQSWIEDRVAKGLVEALMLRRAGYTIYMAQKGDTFGKDSEASVALGQGKPVIVYVPKLAVPAAKVDSEALSRMRDDELKKLIRDEATGEDAEVDDTMDHEALHAQLSTIRLRAATDAVLVSAIRAHWADFGLYEESGRINSTEMKERYARLLDQLTTGDATPEISEDMRQSVIDILVATAMRFERRAALFREMHPLALQVILSSGVLNGILVARSVEACSQLLRALIENRLDLVLEVDEHNYKLVERSTLSTVRVISRYRLLANAFSTFYRREEESAEIDA